MPKPSNASSPVTLPNAEEINKSALAKTIDQAIAAPTFTAAIKSIGRDQTLVVLVSAITRGMGYFSENQRLASEAVTLWADLLLDEYQHESLADISVFLRGAALGKYGQEDRDGAVSKKGETFGALSIVKLNTWFRQYLGEKADTREREMRADQGRHMAAMNDIDQRVLDIAKPVVERVKEEQRAANDAAMMETRMTNLTRQFPMMTDQELRDQFKLVTTEKERAAITDEADRRGLLKEKQPAQ